MSSAINVVVRLRPLLPSEIAAPEPKRSARQSILNDYQVVNNRTVRVVNDTTLIFGNLHSSLDPKDPNTKKERYSHGKRHKEIVYGFDKVLDETATQQQVFEATALPLIDSVLLGYNATVFAYGATGCGKTHTITGTIQEPGIISRAMDALFRRIQNLDKKVQVAVSFLEVYNETIWDLLGGSTPLDLREDDNKVYVSGLSEHYPTTVEQVMQLLLQGNANRKKAPTAANAVSSRSHAVLQIHVSTRSSQVCEHDVMNTATFSIIDLAGSERASATKNRGERLFEGANINRSLLALGNCINALCSGKSNHIPYRDSKLTRLLKYSLAGNCKVVMITNISPAIAHYEETHNTLKYANRAKEIKTKISQNSTELTAHVSLYPKIIADLREELSALKQQVVNVEPYIEKAKKVLDRVQDLRYKYLSTNLNIKDNENKLSFLKSMLVQLQNPQLQQIVTCIASTIDHLHTSNATLVHNKDQLQVSIERQNQQLMAIAKDMTPNERHRFYLDLTNLTDQIDKKLLRFEREHVEKKLEASQSWSLLVFKALVQTEQYQPLQDLLGSLSIQLSVNTANEEIFDDVSEVAESIASENQTPKKPVWTVEEPTPRQSLFKKQVLAETGPIRNTPTRRDARRKERQSLIPILRSKDVPSSGTPFSMKLRRRK